MSARQHPCNLTGGPSLGLPTGFHTVLASEKILLRT